MSKPSPDDAKAEPGADEGRREALAKMGRFTAYTAPALLALLLASKAQAASLPPPP